VKHPKAAPNYPLFWLLKFSISLLFCGFYGEQDFLFGRGASPGIAGTVPRRLVF
jgi:hypothetical protein